jgi:hypothetical protein
MYKIKEKKTLENSYATFILLAKCMYVKKAQLTALKEKKNHEQY